jgi:hypothetical protein
LFVDDSDDRESEKYIDMRDQSKSKEMVSEDV